MLGKRAIAAFFAERNLDTMFHLPGIHTLPLDETLQKCDVRLFMGRHESNIAFMGDGFAKVTGRPGVIITTPGPGLGNVVSGCMEALGDDLPLLIVHVDTERDRAGRGVLHEVIEPERIFTHLTKRMFLVEGPHGLVSTLDAAYQALMAERPGPVLISIPYTLFEKEVPSEPRGTPVVAERQPAVPELAPFEEALEGKERPVIIGGGALMAEDLGPALQNACARSAIPFLTSSAGKGVLREDHPVSFGSALRKGVVKEILAASDMVIAIGTRLRETDSRRRGLKIKELIHFDVDGQWMDRNYPARLKITGNLRPGVETLCEILSRRRFVWNLAELKERQRKEETDLAGTSPGFKIIRLLRSVIPDETVTVWDLNMLSYWAESYFPVFHRRSWLFPRGISPIFYAVPASIGAKIGSPDRPCLCVAGDGGALPALAELATVKQYNIPIVFLIYNNESFGILEEYMTRRYAIRDSMHLTNPDFVRLAHSFGINATRAETLEQLKQIFLHGITWTEPFLIEFKHPLLAPPWEI